MARIAVVNVPYFSHVDAALRLTHVLVRQGHDVTVWAPSQAEPRVAELGAAFVLHNPDMPKVLGMGHVAGLAALTEQLTGELIQELYPRGVELVIHDSQATWGRVAAEYLGLPRAISHPMFPIVAAFAKSLPAGLFPPGPSDEEATAQFSDHWQSIARRWGIELEDTNRVIHSSGEIKIAFTTERVLGDNELDPSWHCVGPLMSPPPPRSAPGERPLVYVCLGTAYNKRPEVFRAVITALAEEPVDVLVSAGVPEHATGRRLVSANTLGELPSNVAFRDFVPGREVLARASLHITHGGCNSVHETLLAGVPMVLIPQAYDQFPLARAIEVLGAGLISVEEPTAIRDAVRVILRTGKAHSRARELAYHLASFDGDERVARVVDQAMLEYSLVRA